MLNRLFHSFAVLILMLSAASAQLSGVVLVDGSLTTASGVQYATLQELADDLVALGVNGPLAAYVIDTGTPFAGFTLGQIPGTSAANTVVIQSLPGQGTRPLINTSSGLNTQGIRLGTGTATTTAGGTGPSYVTIEGFEVANIAGGAGILGVGCTFCTFRNNLVHDCGSGIGLSVSDDCIIEDNEIYGSNHLPGAGGSTSYSGGIFAYYLSARNLIQRNIVRDSADNGIFIGSSGSTTATPDNVVINNMIWNCGTQGSTLYAGGISCRRATNSTIANNSVSMPAASNFACIYLMGGSSTAPLLPSVLANNLLQHNGGGNCIGTEYTGQLPALTDYNGFDVTGAGAVGGFGTAQPGTPFATLAAWQTAQPGFDVNSVEGPAGFIAANDLHVTPSSIGFDSGTILASVVDDFDGTPRPLGGSHDIGAHEVPAVGLFAAFGADVVSGPAPLVVNFTDSSFSSDPGGVLSWDWDLDGDGVSDSTLQNPSFVYDCPGTYSVTLSVTDASNPGSTRTRTGLITVTDYIFGLSTTGVGDLVVTPVPARCYPAATRGFTLISFSGGAGPVGSGGLFGLYVDSFTVTGVLTPPAPGGILSFITTPGLYPDAGALSLPPGSMSAFSGLTLDACEILMDNSFGLVYASNVARVTF